ncbi:MAG: 3-methylornithine--L-lysine ligase PylC [Desulfitobacterium hafniense]|nr:3-methylornithine--L-lysine ligase PylC [Desulfitobacterium hafniense]
MKIVVAGGKLQGVEAAYLAHQAEWDVILIDKNQNVPAVGLCDEFHQLDITSDLSKVDSIIRKADLIIPALENKLALESLEKIALQEEVPIAFDSPSYAISSSKKKSDSLFLQNGVPAPLYWPCQMPVIVKPSGSSGSEGVQKVTTFKELSDVLKNLEIPQDNWVIQEYLEGPSYSIEVLGCQGKYITLQVTDIEVDKGYDCKRVLAPTKLTEPLERQFEQIATKIAEFVNLTGIMDVEIINHNNVLKVLEIDARLPSQTPTVVYKSTGINMLKCLYDIYVRGTLEVQGICKKDAVIYEHIYVDSEKIQTLGEHIMANSGHLKLCKDFFGADEALTNYDQGRNKWIATLIITARNDSEAWNKRCEVIKNIRKKFGITVYYDSTPNV